MSPTEATVDPPPPGSRLDADHPENGVLIPCRFTQGDLHPQTVGHVRHTGHARRSAAGGTTATGSHTGHGLIVKPDLSLALAQPAPDTSDNATPDRWGRF